MEYMSDIWTLIELKRYQEARTRIQAAMLEQPSNAELFYAAAVIENEVENITKGNELVNQGLLNEPNHRGLRYLHFIFLKAMRKFVEAEETIISLLSEFPANPDYLCGYSRLMMMTFYLDKARALCDEALRISPEHKQANNISYLLNLCNGNTDDSDLELKKIVLKDWHEIDFLLRKVFTQFTSWFTLMIDTLSPTIVPSHLFLPIQGDIGLYDALR